MEVKVFESSDSNVKKIVFTKHDAVYEAVLYRYESYYKRTVLCISIQSGCAVGCTFCGTGETFVRNLTTAEIVNQVHIAMEYTGVHDYSAIEKFQIMFMSMGEPFHNYIELKNAIIKLNTMYKADLLVSTIAPDNKPHMKGFISLSQEIDSVGLQFSVHKSTDEQRNELIPFKKKLSLVELRDYGIEWHKQTGRNPYINYCIDGENCYDVDFNNLRMLFPPNIFNMTFSVVCSADETAKEKGFKTLGIIKHFEQKFIECGYNTRLFNPAGQDDIGGGCGMLWFVQKWFKEHGLK